MAESFYELLRAGDQQTSRRETARDNAARLAFSEHKVVSTGVGNTRRANPIDFDVIFLNEPLFTQGATLITRGNASVDPIGTAGVWQWQRNPKGHYIGAYIYLNVTMGDIFFETTGDDVQMTHHLLFQGVGYKDLGQGVTTEAQMLASRPVGFGGLS